MGPRKKSRQESESERQTTTCSDEQEEDTSGGENTEHEADEGEQEEHDNRCDIKTDHEESGTPPQAELKKSAARALVPAFASALRPAPETKGKVWRTLTSGAPAASAGGLPVHRSAAIDADAQVAQQQHTVFNRSAAAELATLTSGAAAASAQPAGKPCGRTQSKLDELLKDAMYDSAQPAFKAFFFTDPTDLNPRTGKASHIPRCLKCGCTIDEHPPDTNHELDRTSDVDQLLSANSCFQLKKDVVTSNEPERMGRSGFDDEIKAAVEQLQKSVWCSQNSIALVLASASGVGKTYATMCFRSGARRIGAPYDAVTAYIGLNQGWPLVESEKP
jgi:hypothetical protein